RISSRGGLSRPARTPRIADVTRPRACGVIISQSGAEMALASGIRLGSYEILSQIGAGGMGEVYRARDMRLERTVAIKVLPDHLSCNADSKQRFEREARALSSLNHP